MPMINEAVKLGCLSLHDTFHKQLVLQNINKLVICHFTEGGIYDLKGIGVWDLFASV